MPARGQQPEGAVLPRPVAREMPLRVDRRAIEDGLSQSIAYQVAQDHDGFMWFVTQHGLNRYDGRSFKVYKSVPFDSTALPNNATGAVMEDARGRLWVATQDGLARMDPEQPGRFLH